MTLETQSVQTTQRTLGWDIDVQTTGGDSSRLSEAASEPQTSASSIGIKASNATSTGPATTLATAASATDKAVPKEKGAPTMVSTCTVWLDHLVEIPQAGKPNRYLLTKDKCQWYLKPRVGCSEFSGSVAVRCTTPKTQGSNTEGYRLIFAFGADYAPFFECSRYPLQGGCEALLTGRIRTGWYDPGSKPHRNMPIMCNAALRGLREWISQPKDKYPESAGNFPPVWSDFPKPVLDELHAALKAVYSEEFEHMKTV